MSADLCDDAQELDLLITRMKDLLVDYMHQSRQTDACLVDYKEPEELEQLMDFSLPDHGVGPEGIFPTITQTLQYNVNTFSPRFMDKLYAGSSPIGVMSELLLAGLNGNSHVYHVAPVFTMMEIHVTRAMARLFGFKGELAGGLTCPGGSASNQLAMVTARNVLYPEIKRHGYFPRPSANEIEELERQGYRVYLGPAASSTYGKLIAFTSSAGHYSLQKSAVMMGLGTENIVGVPCDSYGAMIPEELAGTTVLGAFDPIRPCAEIAKKYNCWLHLDGSWGGSTIFVPELATTLLDGSELVQSITVNPHKMLQTPLQCSLLLVQDASIFPRANSLKANYLFHGQSHDLGDGTLGCGRRSDAVKLFLGWKYYGKLGYRARVEKSLSNVKRFVELLAQDDYRGQRIQMLRLGDQEDVENAQQDTPQDGRDKTMPSLLQVCFWYRPRGSRLIDWRGSERVWKNSAEQQANSASAFLDSAPTNVTIMDGTEAAHNTLVTKLASISSSSSVASLASSSGLVASSVSSMSSGAGTPISGRSKTMTDYGMILTGPQERDEAKVWMENVTKAIHARIRKRGKFMIDYAPLGSHMPIFFRVVLNPPTIREVDLVQLVEEILECGEAAGDSVPIPECCRG
ncbi:hypothetical protein BGX31_002833 [Mortierella sp. GBA43]|nr:hypothetical protein BGX31_002833 [Mortierella sp. GBA43]